MKHIFILLFLLTSLFSFNVDKKIESLISEPNYKSYNKLIKKIFNKKHYKIEEVVSKLINNGLLDIFFKNPKIIQTKFSFVGANPIFETKILYDTLNSLGYYYFYPINIEKDKGKYSVRIEFQSEHFIEPLSIIKEMKTRGCQILDLNRKVDEFIYNFNCENIKIKNRMILNSKFKKVIHSNGIYWINPNQMKKILIYSSRYDFWHPYIVFYDEDLNIIKIIDKNIVDRKIMLLIDENCQYIKIMDSFNKTNIKRGIRIKGLK